MADTALATSEWTTLAEKPCETRKHGFGATRFSPLSTRRHPMATDSK